MSIKCRGARGRHACTVKTISTGLDEALTKMAISNLIIFVAQYSGVNVVAINLPFLEVMIIDTLPFCRADIAEKLETK